LSKWYSVVSRRNKYEQAATLISTGETQVLRGQVVLVPLFPPKIILHGIAGDRIRVSAQRLHRRRTHSMSSYFYFLRYKIAFRSNKNLIQKLMNMRLSRILH